MATSEETPDNSTGEAAEGDWNVVFILRGLRDDHHFRDAHYFLSPCDENVCKTFRRLGEECVEVRQFMNEAPKANLSAAAFRIRARTEADARSKADFYLHGLLDGLAPHVDHEVPKVAPFYLISKAGEADMHVSCTVNHGWAYLHPKEPATGDAWKERGARLFRATLPFFDIAADVHPRRDTPLARQLLYSMKMFRSGAESGIYGVEFLCKWSGLEGLVCGGERSKGALLRERIPALYPLSERARVLGEVEKLWESRNEAAHEARAFCSKHLGYGRSLEIQIETVEWLFAGMVVFALAHIHTAESVKALWRDRGNYELPEFARQCRPSDMARFPIVDGAMRTPFALPGIGRVTDALFARIACEMGREPE